MATTTTLKDKVTYITITPTPSSPTSSIRTTSFDSDREHQLELPFHDTEKHIELPSEHITTLRRGRSHAVRRIRNIIVSIISLAVIFGLCSTGWWMRGLYDSYNTAPQALEMMQSPLETTLMEVPVPAEPSPEKFPQMIAAATAAFEAAKDESLYEMGEVAGDVADETLEWSEEIYEKLRR